MKIKSNLKYLWLAIAVFSLILTVFVWFGFESNELRNSVLALDALMFVLSIPCSLFFVPVAAAAHHYLEINPFSASGIYLDTVFLSVLGFVQWFWIARFWSPSETTFQKLELLDSNIE